MSGYSRTKSGTLECEYQEELSILLHIEVPVAKAAQQKTLPRLVFDPAGTGAHPVATVRRLLRRDQVRALLSNRSVLVRVVNVAQPAETLDLPFAPDVLQFPATPENYATPVVAATGRFRFLLVRLYNNLPGRRLSMDSAPGGDSTKQFSARRDPPTCSVLADGDWWGRAASTPQIKS